MIGGILWGLEREGGGLYIWYLVLDKGIKGQGFAIDLVSVRAALDWAETVHFLLQPT